MSIADCWYRKYEPKVLADMVLSATMKKFTDGVLERGGLSNPILLFGKYGHGKTSFGKLLIRLLKIRSRIVGGGSDDSKGAIKNEIFTFLNTRNQEKKMVLVDEFDGLSAPAKEMFKKLITSTGRDCSYIFTTNHIDNIPKAIVESRINVIDMTPKTEEVKEFETDIAKRLIFIMKAEGYKPTKEDIPFIKKLIQKVPYYNIRKMIVLMQTQLEFEGKLSEKMFEEQTTLTYELLDSIKTGKIKEMQKQLMKLDVHTFMLFLYDNMFTIFKEEHWVTMGKFIGEWNVAIPTGLDYKIGAFGMCCDLIASNKKFGIFGG